MTPLTRGLYTARLATCPQDRATALALRHLCFRAARGQSASTTDADPYDAACQHVLVTTQGVAVAGFRTQYFAQNQSFSGSYAAQFYNLSNFERQPGPMIELGRFCLHPDHPDPDILRLAWASLTMLVDAAEATTLFGCTSFDGADPARHRAALGYLFHHHTGPETFRPGRIAPQTVALSDLAPPGHRPPLPPLLKTYLAMGGWVSDHAVLDHDLDTTHVFTALTIAAIPPARAHALRLLANSGRQTG